MSLRAVNVSMHKAGRQILDGISLELRPGQIHALLGPNGAGKSSLLAALAGEPPTAGVVSLDGQAIAGIRSAAQFEMFYAVAALAGKADHFAIGRLVARYVAGEQVDKHFSGQRELEKA